MKQKRGIALLITAMFVIIISVAIGFALKQVNDSAKYVALENQTYQDFIFVEDVLKILRSSAELKSASDNNSSSELNTFLVMLQDGVPLNFQGVSVILKVQSARSKFAINTLQKDQLEYLLEYFNRYNVRNDYVDLLKDSLPALREEGYFNTTLFEREPTLFRDYIASMKHLKKINKFYKQEYQDDSLNAIDFDQLFSFTYEQNASTQSATIDLNYATAATWELLIGVDADRATELAAHEDIYENFEEFDKVATLNESEKQRLGKFGYSFFEPFLYVKIDIIKENLISHVSFEYNMKSGEVNNFAYEI